jgi:hypothetical protein
MFYGEIIYLDDFCDVSKDYEGQEVIGLEN